MKAIIKTVPIVLSMIPLIGNNKLYSWVNDPDIKIEITDKKYIAQATYQKILISQNIIDEFPDVFLEFIMLHELCHITSGYFISNPYLNSEALRYEEMMADRCAINKMFHKRKKLTERKKLSDDIEIIISSLNKMANLKFSDDEKKQLIFPSEIRNSKLREYVSLYWSRRYEYLKEKIE